LKGQVLATDYTEEVVDDLGLGIEAPSGIGQYGPDAQKWDCSIGGLNFLFATSATYPIKRETARFRRERIDTERNPGEQSLDSGYWIRSQASWHYGAGIPTAEPLEVNTEEARFRYFQGGGVDPWTPGELTLLNSTSAVYTASASWIKVDGIGTGILAGANYSGTGTLTYITNAGASTAITWGGAGEIGSFDETGQYWLASDTAGIWRGNLPSGSGTKIYNNKGTPTYTLIRWVKSRAMYAEGPDIHEITNLTPSSATLPTRLYRHPNDGWIWTDFADGPNSIYASGYSGEYSAIYSIGINTTPTTVTLDQPTIVAEMPRGEDIISMYQYVGSFLVIGTTLGLRVAQINTDGSLTVGPLIFNGGPVDDAVGKGRFLYFTVRDRVDAGNRKLRPGLYRMNLGQVLNNTPLDFAYAADLVTPEDHPGDCIGVTVANDKLWFGVTGTPGGVYRQNDTFVDEGWLETGRIRLGTMEKKAWRDLRLLGINGLQGTVTAYANIFGTTAPSNWDAVVSVTGGNEDAVGKLNVPCPSPSTDLYLAFHLQSNPSCGCSAKMIGYQVRAVPSPRRTELIEVPVMMFNSETDRMGGRYGAFGNAFKRFKALKALEESGATVPFIDFTTGEKLEVYVEEVAYNRISPPSRAKNVTGSGGVVRILLRTV
jgi:hypothetical protein